MDTVHKRNVYNYQAIKSTGDMEFLEFTTEVYFPLSFQPYKARAIYQTIGSRRLGGEGGGGG